MKVFIVLVFARVNGDVYPPASAAKQAEGFWMVLQSNSRLATFSLLSLMKSYFNFDYMMAPEQKITCAGGLEPVIRPTQLKLQHVLDIFMNLVTRVVRIRFVDRHCEIETSCNKK